MAESPEADLSTRGVGLLTFGTGTTPGADMSPKSQYLVMTTITAPEFTDIERPSDAGLFTIEVQTEPYNARRYGVPWLAKVTFSPHTARHPDHAFGDWDGDRKGGPGTLRLRAKPGDVLLYGQNDLCIRRRSLRQFYIVRDTGELQPASRFEAFDHQWPGQQ